MPVRTGSINATGAIPEANYFGATSDFNISLQPSSAGTWTVKLERRFNDSEDAVANEGDRLLTLAGDTLTTLGGDQLFTIGAADDGFRVCEVFTNATSPLEFIGECVGPTEFRLNCTDLTSGGPIEYRLG